ncbi:MAG: YhbY family RNA-binding protein [Acidobacteria bacterium]|nr:YhbY family RNA-binding protein [Acidobacteriota bacterium]
MNQISLTAAQKRSLKSAAHHLKAVVQMGKEGPSQGFVRELDVQLNTHELMKFRVLNNCLASREDIEHAIVLAHAVLIQRVGHVWTIFRKRHENSAFPEI